MRISQFGSPGIVLDFKRLRHGFLYVNSSFVGLEFGVSVAGRIHKPHGGLEVTQLLELRELS